jgi:hypothetical protein
MPRVFYKFMVFAGICLAALLTLPALLQLFRPASALYTHIDSIPWDGITVESSNLPTPRSFDRSAQEIRISPISQGIYRISVRLSDGQTIWSEFFHYDAGVRRRIDVFVAPSQRAGYVHFRETTNQKEQHFDGETFPEIPPRRNRLFSTQYDGA